MRQPFQCGPVPVHLRFVSRNKRFLCCIMIRLVINQDPLAHLKKSAVNNSLHHC